MTTRSLTGVREVDQKILTDLSGKELSKACTTDSYIASLCDDCLWYLKLNQLLNGRVTIRNPPREVYREIEDKNEQEILNWAVLNNEPDIVRLLNARRKKIETDDDYYLQIAARRGYVEIVTILLQSGLYDQKEIDSALVPSAINNQLASTRLLIFYGADPNANNHEALSAALSYADAPLVKLLIEAGGQLDQVIDGLAAAADHGKIDTVKLLLSPPYIGLQSQQEKDSALYWAINAEQEEIVPLLLNVGANPNYRIQVTNDKLSNLELAVYRDNITIIKMLLDAHADINAPPARRIDDNVLAIATRYSDTSILELLLSYGPNLHLHNDNAINRAVERSNLGALNLLLNYSMESDSPYSESTIETLIDYAQRSATLAIVARLRDYLKRLKSGVRKEVNDGQCCGKTLKGDRCKLKSRKGYQYCSKHEKK